MKKFTIQFYVAVFTMFFLSNLSVFAQQVSIWDRFPEEVKSRNWFKRYEWFMRPRMFPYDTLPIYTFRAELKKEMEKDKLNKGNNLNDLQWANIGPSGIIYGEPSPHWGELSGRIRGIAVHPTDPNTVYIAVAAGGIWKTTDGGQSWNDIANSLPSVTYGAITIDPNNPNIIYAGGGEVVFGNPAPYYYEGAGVYKSMDGGMTWAQNINGFGSVTFFGDIEVSPQNPNLIFAALGSGNYFRGNMSNEGIWRSTDAGATWNRTLNVADAYDIIVHPTDPNIVYAATGGGVTTAGFYRSTDSGLTWLQSNSGLPASSTVGRIQVSLSNSFPSIIYAIIYQGTNTPVAYKSTNSGDFWFQISAGTQLGGNYGSGWVDQGDYDLCIAVNPSNENHVFVGNVELHQTFNGSNFSVKRIPGGTNAWDCPTHTDIHKIVFSPSNANIVYLGCDGGIYKSTDAGDTWSSANNGIRTIQHYRVASHPTNPNILISGAQDNSNFRTIDRGMTPWESISTGDGMECFFDYNNPDSIIYFSAQNGYLWKSTDLGNSLIYLGTYNGYWVTPFIMHPTNNQYLYVASTNIYRSTDGGATVPFEMIASLGVSQPATSMAQSPVNPLNMITCGSYSTFYVKVSTDGGFTWANVSNNTPGWNVRVVCHPSDANTMFLVKSGFSPGDKLYITTDLGASWTNISNDLPDVPQDDLFIDPLIPTDYYIANDLGVYKSTNAGENWIREGNGMPFVPVMDFDYIELGPENRLLRAATYGRSIYEVDLQIPVELTSLTVIAQPNYVELNWTTATEINNQGFEIQRSTSNSEFVSVGFVAGNGTTTEEHHYSYKDENVSGFLRYRLKQIDFDGSLEYSEIVEVEVLGNVAYELAQNYPNPFNPITNISYTLPTESQVKLFVYNPLGELVAIIVNEKQSAGKYDAVWNGGNHPSGVYIYTLDAVSLNGNKQTKISKKMILLK